MAMKRLPAFMKTHADFGDLGLPRLKLLHALSPELTSFDDASEGEFWHGLTNERLGSTIRICPVYIDSRFVLWRPWEAGGGILARADDGKHWTPADTEFEVKLKSGRAVTWRTARTVKASGLDKPGSYDPSDPNSPPAARRVYAIACTFPDRHDLPPAVVILQRAAIKATTWLIRELKALRVPSFGVVVEMAALSGTVPSGGSGTYAFEIVGPVEHRAQYEENFLQYRFFMEQGLKLRDLEGAQGEEPE